VRTTGDLPVAPTNQTPERRKQQPWLNPVT